MRPCHRGSSSSSPRTRSQPGLGSLRPNHHLDQVHENELAEIVTTSEHEFKEIIEEYEEEILV